MTTQLQRSGFQSSVEITWIVFGFVSFFKQIQHHPISLNTTLLFECFMAAKLVQQHLTSLRILHNYLTAFNRVPKHV